MKLGLIVLAVLVLGLAPRAAVAVPPALREGTHPLWVTMTLGPVIAVRDPKYHGYEGDAPTQITLMQTLGVHFSGRADGPAFAFDLQEGFGDSFTVFAVVPKFVYDIRVVSGLGFYLSPIAGLGFALAAPDCECPRFFPDCGCDNYLGLTLQLGFEGKLVLGDRGLVFFRPFHLEIDLMHAPDPIDEMGTAVRYGLLFGGGVIF